MANLTIRAGDDLLAELDTEAEDETDGNRAAYVRQLLENRNECDERAAALESELADCRRECERLKREKRQILDQRDEHRELVRAVEREQSLAEKRAQAGLGTKLKWALFGMKDE